jgi:translation initiation factor 2 alpha subunit (eIF-2alpha)
MFYYEKKIPTIGTIVVANLVVGEDSDSCIYVTLPEYNDIRGIMYTRDLPKRLKQYKKTLQDMKQAGQFVCSVALTPSLNLDDTLDLVELSMKGVDPKYHPSIITRQLNIEKILKLVKFLSNELKLDFNDLIQPLQKEEIVPLMEITDISEEHIDNFIDKYLNYLRSYDLLLNHILVESSDKLKASEILKSIIKETDASLTLDFDLFVWKGSVNDDMTYNDPMFIMRNTFNHISSTFSENNIQLRYIGAPSYQINFSRININNIDNILESIKKTIIEYMKSNKVIGYDLKFDISKANIKRGEISIMYPYKIEL